MDNNQDTKKVNIKKLKASHLLSLKNIKSAKSKINNSDNSLYPSLVKKYLK